MLRFHKKSITFFFQPHRRLSVGSPTVKQKPTRSEKRRVKWSWTASASWKVSWKTTTVTTWEVQSPVSTTSCSGPFYSGWQSGTGPCWTGTQRWGSTTRGCWPTSPSRLASTRTRWIRSFTKLTSEETRASTTKYDQTAVFDLKSGRWKCFVINKNVYMLW